MKKEKTVITIETLERKVIRLSHKEIVAWCEQCRAEVLMLSPNQAAANLQITAREIFRRVEAGEAHFIEMSDGALLICHNSLAQQRQTERNQQ